ncbi:CA14.2 family protein [Megaselia abdita]
MANSLVFGVVLALWIQYVSPASFEYVNQAKWYDDYSQCSFKRQSPIELNTNESKISYDLPKLYFNNYQMLYPQKVVVENNGHTANINLPKVDVESLFGKSLLNQILPQIYGGPLHADRFIAESVHFHWGSKDTHGSEHVIDSTRHTMEMHILHRNSKYDTVEVARENPDGLAVTAVIFQAHEDNYDFSGLNSVIERLDMVENYNTTTEIESFFILDNLITGLDSDSYFTYEGSLTTPPCSESVTWVVFTDILPMSHFQMKKFHKLRDEHNTVLQNNYRSLQAKGSRVVTLRKHAVKK